MSPQRRALPKGVATSSFFRPRKRREEQARPADDSKHQVLPCTRAGIPSEKWTLLHGFPKQRLCAPELIPSAHEADGNVFFHKTSFVESPVFEKKKTKTGTGRDSAYPPSCATSPPKGDGGTIAIAPNQHCHISIFPLIYSDNTASSLHGGCHKRTGAKAKFAGALEEPKKCYPKHFYKAINQPLNVKMSRHQ